MNDLPHSVSTSGLDELLARVRRLPSDDWLQAVRSDQAARWRAGRGVPVEASLGGQRDSPGLARLPAEERGACQRPWADPRRPAPPGRAAERIPARPGPVAVELAGRDRPIASLAHRDETQRELARRTASAEKR
jgi:hypothetical protein